jgi:flagellar M-ring protein FliF
MADTDTNTNVSMARLLFGIPTQQKLALIIAVASTVALLAGLFLWGSTPDYRVLYANLSERDGGSVIESLQQQNIPYKFSEGGTLLVPADRVHELRLQMAAKGLPKGGTVGFELMENQKFGTSQFLEQVNYQRALEGELARSVETMAPVASARVHLAIPKQTVFAREQQKPGASVVLSLHAGRTLDAAQVSAIVHLISSSVSNMPSQAVTVVDQSGTLLSSARDNASELLMDATQIKYVRQIEMDYVKRIEDILMPLTGMQNVRAQVTASLDFAQSEQTAETYRPNQSPNQASVRSLQTQETLNGTGGTGGVPGALSNRPPVPATAPITSPAVGAAGLGATASNAHKELTTNYEVDRTIQHTKLPAGAIKRLSVAVVVNNPSRTDKDGKVTSRPYTEAEIAQLTALVKETIGFDAKRGDSLNLLNSAFNSDAPQEAVAEIPMWKQPDNIALAKDILKYLLIPGGIIYLLLGVIRPAYRTVVAQSAAQEEALAAQYSQVAHGGNAAGLYAAQQANNSYEDNLQLAKQLTKDDPKIVASVVKQWVNKDE